MSFVSVVATLLLLFIFAAGAKLQRSEKDASVSPLNEDNWDLMLTGEWMVEL